MMYKAGWLDRPESELPLYHSLEEVGEAWPMISFISGPLDEEGEVTSIPPEKYDEQEMLKRVEEINSEGNYHDFLLRPAFAFEVRPPIAVDPNIRMVDVHYQVRGRLYTTLKVPANLLFAYNDPTLDDEASAKAEEELNNYFSGAFPPYDDWESDWDDETWEEVKE